MDIRLEAKDLESNPSSTTKKLCDFGWMSPDSFWICKKDWLGKGVSKASPLSTILLVL